MAKTLHQRQCEPDWTPGRELYWQRANAQARRDKAMERKVGWVEEREDGN